MTNATRQDANWVIAERKLLSQPAGAVRRSSSPQPSNPPELMPASGLSTPEVLCASSRSNTGLPKIALFKRSVGHHRLQLRRI